MAEDAENTGSQSRPSTWKEVDFDFDIPSAARRNTGHLVHGPGTGLFVCGWAGFAVSAFLLFYGSIGFSVGGVNADTDSVIAGTIFTVMGILGFLASAVLAMGGARMRQFRSYRLSLTAAVLGIAAFAYLGICGLPVLPFGAWALVALLSPDVKREFDRRRGNNT
jgi:hypothetical protein